MMEKSLFASLGATLKEYRWRFFLGFLMVLASNLLLILNPLVMRQAVMALDSSSGMDQGALAHFLKYVLGEKTSSLTYWCALLIVITLVSAYFKFKMRITFISVSRDLEKTLRSKIFEKIQRQSMAFYDRHGIGELLSRLTNDISLYRDVLGPGVMYPLFLLTLVIPGIIALFTISAELAAISLIPLLTLPLLNQAVRTQIYTLSRLAQKSLGEMSNMAQEHFAGIRIIKCYVAEHALYRRFRTLCESLVGLNMRIVATEGMLYPFLTTVTKAVTVVLVLFSGYIILRAWGELSLADFVSFMWIQSYVFFPVLMLGWLLPIYQKGRAAYDRLVEIYDEPIEVVGNEDSPLKIALGSSIELHHLSFSYPGTSREALSDVTLSIPGGSFIGITGPIGSGKTTLFRLLNREYEVPRGMISIGGRDIHDYSLEAFRSEMVTVEQAPFLFSKTIAENVRFGHQEASMEEIQLVAEFADLHDTVQSFPEQYETVVGERGMTLSGGQKQRVAMARAFLVNRSILLLDDIFSAVDTATEKRIFESMKKNFAGKTVLLITHRITILEKTDRVLYIQNGKVLEDGAPESLMARQGHYAALAELQRLSATS